MIPVPTRGLGDLAERLFVSIPRQRAANRLETIREQLRFAREFELVRPEQKKELAEMLLAGAPLSAAVSELRDRRAARNELARGSSPRT